MKSTISTEKQLIKSEWAIVTIPITLVIGYATQPRGDIEIKHERSIVVDFNQRLLAALDYQQREQERMREQHVNNA
jgi:hypothetical protein